MVAPARRVAYEALRAVTSGTSDLPAALARGRAVLRDPRDRALAYEVASGTLRWLAALDHVIEQVAGRSLQRVDTEVRDLLRLGAYQLIHLDRVPAAAVVDDAVTMTRRAGRHRAAGFVNAVLRAVARARGALPLPSRPGADPEADREGALDYLSITLSHPRWLVRRWLEREGFDAVERWTRFNNRPAPLTLRANRLKTTASELARALGEHGVDVEPTGYAPDGLVVVHGNPLATPMAAQGLFLVQDEASQLVPFLLQARPGETILDTCAAPGGKTVALAAAMGLRGVLVAADLRERRLRLLRRTLATCGAPTVRVLRLDLRQGVPLGAVCDGVLVDAPCSGLGTIRRDPEIRWRRSEADLAAFAEVELEMLVQAADAVRPGGRLVYATCSSEPEENDGVVAGFLDTRPDFEAVDPRSGPTPLPAGVLRVLDDAGRLVTQPPAHGLEAFFAAMLVKRKHL